LASEGDVMGGVAMRTKIMMTIELLLAATAPQRREIAPHEQHTYSCWLANSKNKFFFRPCDLKASPHGRNMTPKFAISVLKPCTEDFQHATSCIKARARSEIAD
jgi:hypothetical protein